MSARDDGAARTVTADGRLGLLNDAGVLDGSDCIVARRVSALVGEDPAGNAALAMAFAVRAVRDGSTALSLDSVAGLSADSGDGDAEADAEDPVTAGSVVDLPEPARWLDCVRASPLATEGILRVDLGLVYLERYHADERLIADSLRTRHTSSMTAIDTAAADGAVGGARLDESQSAAVQCVLDRATTVLTGGPGMGKTYTITSVLRALRAAGRGSLRIGLAAPTGKAAARMNEMLQDVLADDPSVSRAVTLHRLLGSRPDTRARFRHNARNPLPYDVVIVDEASMVSLSLMARLIEALPSSTRLLLVGDPDQLTSVEAGSVLADLVRGLETHDSVIRLTKDHRLHDDRATLAEAFRRGDADAVLHVIDTASRGVEYVEADEPTLELLPRAVEHAVRLRDLALAGEADAALEQLNRFRLLCAHRTGPYGTQRWNRLIEQALAEHAPEVSMQAMYVGRPILVTRNDYGLGVNNGDTGVIVSTEDGPRAVLDTGSGVMRLAPWRLSDIETMHAMTVHKAQGSQAQDVTAIIPPPGSRLLTREMLYTAVTRAERHLTVIGSRAAIREAVDRPAQRASGLAQRLKASG